VQGGGLSLRCTTSNAAILLQRLTEKGNGFSQLSLPNLCTLVCILDIVIPQRVERNRANDD
jgi:hypothetical protein